MNIVKTDSTWHLVHTKPRQEMVARIQLERQGYNVYLPMLCRHRLKRGVRVECMLPLFPRYLFIRLVEGRDDWSPIRSTRGVCSLVRFGTEIVRVSDDLIGEIQSRTGADGYHREQEPVLKHGDKVKVTDGPFSGYEAIFQAGRGEDRVLILMDVIGKETRTEMTVDFVAKIDT